ncbi:MAG: hypothetical protein ACLQVI_25890 [Polyangiaceae bacterium]|jgi:hypothetical protein
MKRWCVAAALLPLLTASAACVEGVTVGHPSSGASDTAVKRRLVHVDHVDPAKAAQFEEARRQLLAAYAAKSLNEGTTTLIETKDEAGGPVFLSLRPFGAYAEIDRLNDAAAVRAASIGKELDRLDAMTHATLVPPHLNEIWILHGDLSYAPAGAPSEADASAARLQVDDVAPSAGDDYEAAVKGITAALGRAKSPVARLAFTSSYGTGEYVTLWLARSAPDLAAIELGEVGAAIRAASAKAQKSTMRVAFLRRELSTR